MGKSLFGCPAASIGNESLKDEPRVGLRKMSGGEAKVGIEVKIRDGLRCGISGGQ